MLFYLRNRVVIVASVATTKADLGLEKHQNMFSTGTKASKIVMLVKKSIKIWTKVAVLCYPTLTYHHHDHKKHHNPHQ